MLTPSSQNIEDQEMERQGVPSNRTSDIYENPLRVQFRAYENVQVRANPESASTQKHQQETASNGKNSQGTTVLLVLCLVVTIACSSATVVLFTKVMNNEKLHTKLNTISTNFNITSLEKKIDMKLSEIGARMNDTNNSISKLRSLEKKVDMKLSEISVRFDDTDNSISKLRNILLVESCALTSMNGVYTSVSGGRVYCLDGWTVFQRRMDGSIPDFHNKTWEHYSQGFGSMTGEFWLGLRKLHNITRQGGCRLRVDLQSFDNDTAYAEYSQFSVSSEAEMFRLSIGGYSGTAGNSMQYSDRDLNGMMFTTADKDNDRWSLTNCARSPRNYGGWWHKDCSYAFPNAIYGRSSGTWRAIVWYTWKKKISLKSTMLKVRCD